MMRVVAPPLRATYRLQLDRDFDLARARALVPYLARLGVSHAYASPMLAARAGSTHGYDVVDPRALDPKLGTDDDRRAFVDALAAHGMGHLLDIVPNHMAASRENPFWEDVLAHGPASPYARWFDITWRPAALTRRARVLLPVLGRRRADVIAADEIHVAYEDGRFRVAYHEHSWPIDPRTLGLLFPRPRTQRPAARGDATTFARTLDALARAGERPNEETEAALDRLARLARRSPLVRERIDDRLRRFSAGEAGRRRLRALLDAQHYSLGNWRRASRHLQYRRFFDVNELVALRQEDPQVFDATHARVLAWIGEGAVHGLRVDHVDGLLDPLDYLERLRGAVARHGADDATAFPIFVEKILAAGESLRAGWPVDGTTGYEFLNELESALIDPAGFARVRERYLALVGRDLTANDFAEVAFRAKLEVVTRTFASEVRRLGRLAHDIARHDRAARALTRAECARGVALMLAGLPVYRTYRRSLAEPAHPDDRIAVRRALAVAIGHGGSAAAACRFIARVLLDRRPSALGPRLSADRRSTGRDDRRRLSHAESREPRAEGSTSLELILRFQQASGPAAAKGVEDTALYRFVPLASRNEVGGDPDAPLGAAVRRLHEANAERAARWPRQLLCTSTHDTKRSADVRARLDALSEIADEWSAWARTWLARSEPMRARSGRRRVPDANTLWLLLETLVGIWPFAPDGRAPDDQARRVLAERVGEYMRKAAREAKLRTSWTRGDEAFERALADIVRRLVVEAEGAPFRDALGAMVSRVARPGMWNALARTLVHLGAPGVPDIYQGDELWNPALVDPDNRRPVDYSLRERAMDELDAAERVAGPLALARALLARAEDGRIKLHLVRRVLAVRREHPDLFALGDYRPLAATELGARHAIAFARAHEGRAIVVVVPRLTVALRGAERAPVGGVWRSSVLELPRELASMRWRDALTGATHEASSSLSLARVLAEWPVALLASETRTRKG